MKIETRDLEKIRETRTLTSRNFEVRAADDGKTVKVTGYAAIFDEETDLGYFREIIRPGAFKNCLSRNDDVRFLINHTDLPLARTASGTLKLSEDKRGLKMESTLDASDPDVMRIVPKMERGDLNQMSFAFTIGPDGEYVWIERGDGDDTVHVREIKRVGTLFDVAIVTYPAYDGTEIALRSLADFRSARGKTEPNSIANANARARMEMELRLKKSGR